MSDLIRRADAIEAVREHKFHAIKGSLQTKPWYDAINEVLEIISALPSAEAVRGWIPCSERFPEDDGCYLVTTSGTYNDIIDIAYYTDGLWHKASRILAWMPLPKPYKGGDDE